MRKLISVFLLLFLFAGCGSQERLSGWEDFDLITAKERRQLHQEILQAESLLNSHPGASADEKEALLMEAGLSTLDSNAIYPAYLSDPECLTAFYTAAGRGEDSSASIYCITGDALLRHLLFLCRDGESWFFTADVGRNRDGRPCVLEMDVLPIQDMELSESGVFYYRIYPEGDPHYIDYGQIRLQPVDSELYDLNREYVIPVGYLFTNLFLLDWQEGDWDVFSFNDFVDSLYVMNAGTPFPWEEYPCEGPPTRIQVPAEVFESAILPHFAITREELRTVCQYSEAGNAYPYRPIDGDELASRKYPMCEPEAVQAIYNSDGTITLDIRVISPDLKGEVLFCHTLTVRPVDNSGFQYVSNRVTYMGSHCLPPAMSRFELDA